MLSYANPTNKGKKIGYELTALPSIVIIQSKKETWHLSQCFCFTGKRRNVEREGEYEEPSVIRNSMSKIRYGCQTYPWKMNQEKFQGQMPHIIQVASQAGFEGIEAEIGMLGSYFHQPDQVAELLAQQHMELAALVLHQPWQGAKETPEEKSFSDQAIAFVSRFPQAKLMLSHHAGDIQRGTGEALYERRQNLIRCMESVTRRAGEQGIVCCFHPNSGKNSLFRTEEDYRILFDFLYRTDIGYAPDIGHIANGGMDPLAILRQYQDKVRHVHFKDRLGPNEWAIMGEGTIDYPAIVRYLEEQEYRGWVMVEDESLRALQDSDEVVRLDGLYMAQFQNRR